MLELGIILGALAVGGLGWWIVDTKVFKKQAKKTQKKSTLVKTDRGGEILMNEPDETFEDLDDVLLEAAKERVEEYLHEQGEHLSEHLSENVQEVLEEKPSFRDYEVPSSPQSYPSYAETASHRDNDSSSYSGSYYSSGGSSFGGSSDSGGD